MYGQCAAGAEIRKSCLNPSPTGRRGELGLVQEGSSVLGNKGTAGLPGRWGVSGGGQGMARKGSSQVQDAYRDDRRKRHL